jgi:hypothetical protein
MKFNKTLKNTQSKKCCREYSEGFKRRMTDDITFVPYNPEPDELKRINDKFDRLNKYLNPPTDNNFVENFSKRRAEYLESVKNGTNQY